jgi:hypothetical protein
VGRLIDALLPDPYESLFHGLPTFGALIITIWISDSAPSRDLIC